MGKEIQIKSVVVSQKPGMFEKGNRIWTPLLWAGVIYILFSLVIPVIIKMMGL